MLTIENPEYISSARSRLRTTRDRHHSYKCASDADSRVQRQINKTSLMRNLHSHSFHVKYVRASDQDSARFAPDHKIVCVALRVKKWEIEESASMT